VYVCITIIDTIILTNYTNDAYMLRSTVPVIWMSGLVSPLRMSPILAWLSSDAPGKPTKRT
jgi:hypothetical protein